jgi:thioredoxin reductase (NADPH)
VEHALNCYRAGAQVTWSIAGPHSRPSVKYWLKPDVENRIKAGEIAARWGARVVGIDPATVTIASEEGSESIPADRVFLLTGYHPDFDFFRSLGIQLDPDTCKPALNPETLESNVPGIHLAGSVTAGKQISEIFIEWAVRWREDLRRRRAGKGGSARGAAADRE